MFRTIPILLVLFLSTSALAKSNFSPFSNDEKPKSSLITTDKPLIDNINEVNKPHLLSVSQAFQFSIEQKKDLVLINVEIAPKYKLYEKKLSIEVTNGSIEPIFLPESTNFNDPEFGMVKVFENHLSFSVPLIRAKESELVINYQGCSLTLCYPPDQLKFKLDDFTSKANKEPNSLNSDLFEEAYNKSFISQLAWYFILGIGLALTPCVFPMYPIISASVLGDREKTSKRVFLLSFSYVQGMALVYSLVGLLVAIVGFQFQIMLQHPIVLSSIAVIFVILSGSMFGWYTLQPPIKYQSKIGEVNQKQEGGSVSKSFFMGAVSGLVASPCTTAPLVGVLLLIAQTGDALQGFLSLYALSIGMGVPLILFALTGGKLMPKAGAWMNYVKVMFGFSLLSMAVYFVSRFLPDFVTYIITSLLIVSFAWSILYMKLFSTKTKDSYRSNFLIGTMLVATLIFVNFVSVVIEDSYRGNSIASEPEVHLFTRVSNKDELDLLVSGSEKDVIIDLYADWCSACLQYEKNTFSNSEVKERLANYNLIQIDLSSRTDFGDYFSNKYDVLGLPAILFLRKDSDTNSLVEDKPNRASGYMSPKKFIKHLDNL